MRIRIRHLGKIEQAEFDLRPITLLVGENNTNKSWTAYALYALLREMDGARDAEIHPRMSAPKLLQHISNLAEQASERVSDLPVSADFNLEFSRQTILEPLESDLHIHLGPSQLSVVLAIPELSVKDARVSLSIPLNDLRRGPEYFRLSKRGDGTIIYGSMKRPTREASSPADLGEHIGTFVDELDSRLAVTFSSAPTENWERLIKNLLINFACEVFQTVVALPAERKALVTLYRALRDAPNLDLPLPMKHFITALRNAESQADSQKRLRLPKRSPYLGLQSRLLGLLGGSLDWDDANGTNRLAFSPKKGISIPIQAASSMVRSLTGWVLAFQQFGRSRNVLVIDEPEMNAHPSAQLALVEIMGALANLGNYVIATTHSPYVLDHFNNLLAAGELDPEKRKLARTKFLLRSERAFLSIEDVAAYELSAGGVVTSLIDTQRARIKSTTFGNVSSRLENLYNDLLEMNQK